MVTLKDFENKYIGERCFLFGNGPSINRTKGIENIKDEICFGVNRFYRSYPYSCYPTFLAIADQDIFKKEWEELLQSEIVLFLSGLALKRYEEISDVKDIKPDVLVLDDIYRSKADFNREQYDADSDFIEYLRKLKDGWGAYACGTVIMDLALPIIYKMGFSEIYLLGVDLTNDGHFYNVETTDIFSSSKIKAFEANFTSFNDFFKEEGRIVYNATEGGKLNSFNRISLEEVLKK